MTGSTAFWYASRATGVVALVLLTVTLTLGLVVTRRGRLPGLPRFAVTGLHRNLSLLALAFITVHVLTAVLDSYVSIPLAAVVYREHAQRADRSGRPARERAGR